MRGERRSFLGKAVGGLLGALGLLWAGAAQAGHRGRRCWAPVNCPPAVPFCPAPPQPGTYDVITILYPTGGTVPGNGGFYAWGTSLSGVMVTGATCGGVTGIAVAIPQADAGTTQNTWAFLFNQVPQGGQTLTVKGQQMMQPVSASVNITV